MSMEPIAVAVIGGTGLYRLAGLEDAEEHQPVTRYGALSGPVRVGRIPVASSVTLAPGSDP